MNKKRTYTQSALCFRLLAGGYLLYTAWGLRDAISEHPLFIVAIVFFAVVGAMLVVQSGLRLYKKEYEGGAGAPQPEAETDQETE